MKNIVLLLLITSLISCSSKTIDYNVSENEAKAFAKLISESIAEEQPEVLNKAFNHFAFAQKIGSKIIKPNEVTSLLKGMDLGSKITQEVKTGTYELVKVFEKNNKRYILFRLVGNNGVNYHELELCKEKNKVQIADFFIYLTGENLSATIANLYKSMKNSSNQDNESYHLTNTLPKIKKLMSEAKYEEAYEKYNSLPVTLKKNKTVMMYKVLLTQNMSDSLYNIAITEYKESGVEQSAFLDFLLIDGYIIAKKYDKALEAVNSLDNYINKDPYLDFFRYNILTRKGEDAKALPYLENAAKNMPNAQEIQIELIYNYKELNKKEALKESVDKYKANKKFDQQTLTIILNS